MLLRLMMIDVLMMRMVSLFLFSLYFIMPPTSKKLEGHIASGTFVRACVRLSVHACVRPLRFLMHSITYEPCMLGF